MVTAVAVAASAAALALHGTAAVFLAGKLPRTPPAVPAPRKTAARACGGACAAAAYLAESSLQAAGIRLPGAGDVSAGSLAVFTFTQAAWLAGTAWDAWEHRPAPSGAGAP